MRQDLLGSFLWDQVFIWRSPRGTPKSSILIIGYSWIFHYKPSSYWGIPMDTSHTWSTQGGLVVTSIFMVSSLWPMAVGHSFNSIWANRQRILLLNKTRPQTAVRGFGPYEPRLFGLFDLDQSDEVDLAEFKILPLG